MADLFDGPRRRSAPRQIVAVCPYCDLHGVIYSEKVRSDRPSHFRWRVPVENGYRWSLGEVRPGLYHAGPS